MMKSEWIKSQTNAGKHEERDRAELQSFLGFDPTQTPWCKWFTNSCARAVWIPLNSWGSLSSLTGVNDGRPLRQNEQPLPWDVVVVRRDGWGHIWFCLWISPNGHPIIIGWNQSNMVSVKEETRTLVWISRIAWEPSETPTETPVA